MKVKRITKVVVDSGKGYPIKLHNQCQYSAVNLHPGSIGYAGYREQRSRGNGMEPSKCMRHATYTVDGVEMCTQHAGMVALNFLENEGDSDAED